MFTAVAVLSLALGIGANTAIFTLLDQILLRMLPVKNPRELVLLSMKGFHYGGNWGGNALSFPMYRDFKANNKVFTEMFCRFPFRVSLGYNGQSWVSWCRARATVTYMRRGIQFYGCASANRHWQVGWLQGCYFARVPMNSRQPKQQATRSPVEGSGVACTSIDASDT